MMESLSSGAAAAMTFAGAVFISFFPGVDASVVIGAFAGAVFSFLKATDASARRRMGLAAVSMVLGMLAADMTAAIVTELTPEAIVARAPLGAGIAAALSVTVLSSISDFFSDWRRVLEWVGSKFKFLRGGDQ